MESFAEVWWNAMPLSLLLAFGDLKSCMRYISENPIIDEAFVRTHPEFCWDTEVLSRKYANQEQESHTHAIPVRWDLVAQNPYVYDIWQLCKEGIVTVKDIQRHPSIPWSFWALSENPSLTWEIVEAFPDAYWEYDLVLRNPMPHWHRRWECDRECKRIQTRTRTFKEELMMITGQTGYYFRCCKSAEELAEDDELTLAEVEVWKTAYPVSFRSPWSIPR